MTDNVGQSREGRHQAPPSLRLRSVEAPEQWETAPVEEVSLRDLNRSTGRVIAAAEDGTRLILTRHGTPVAIVVSIADFVDIVEPPIAARPLPTIATIRRSLREILSQVLGDEVLRRLRRREMSRMLHGRWY